MGEAEFLLAIRQDPNDESLRLAYANLLAEQGDGLRATFLRVECQLYPRSPYDALAVALQQQLADECRTIDFKWVAAVSRSPVHGCPLTGGGHCRKRRWEQLQVTEDPRLRPCDACVADVFFCDSIETVREGLAWYWVTVAFDPRIVRHPGDLQPTEEMVEWARAHADAEVLRSRESIEPGESSDPNGRKNGDSLE